MKQELPANTTLSHYRIVAKLGAGGMGEVYRARDTRLDREVAIKILPADFAKDADRIKRFEQEARATSALNHPNILTVYDTGTHEGAPFIVAELLEGEELRAQLEQGTLPLRKVLDYAQQIAAGLAAAHEKGVVHRDLKPENLFVTTDGRVKILDFGLAKLRPPETASGHDSESPTQRKVTDPGTVMGTASYMSPEQARGQEVDARSDIFSLGVVLYEMLAGCSPFTGVNGVDIIGAILNQEPLPLRQHSPNTPAELQRIVTKALRKDREQRYQHVKDLRIDLRDLKQELEFEAKLKGAQMFGVPPSGGSVHLSEIPPEGGTTNAQPAEASTNAVAATRTTSSTEIILGEIKRHRLGVTFALVALAAMAIAAWYFLLSARSGEVALNSVAVLRFANGSSDQNLDYLSDGLGESLIDRLSQLPQLKVIARGSSFKYRGQEVDPQEVAQALGVRAIVIGRVMQRGDSLTVRAELVDARTKIQMWGETYQRKAADIQAVQEEIVRTISEKLRVRLTGAQEQQLTKRATKNPEAYQLYLNGQFYLAEGGIENRKKALDYFDRAVTLDPNFALAWVGIATIYRLLEAASALDPKEGRPKAKAALMKALALDESLAEMHEELGNTKTFEWDWAGAEREYQRAIELAPNSGNAHSSYAYYLTVVQRHTEALAEIKRAQEINPLEIMYRIRAGGMLQDARRHDEAVELLRNVIPLVPNHSIARFYLGYSYAAKGLYAEAIAEYQKSISFDSADTGVPCYLGYVLAQSGKPDEARTILKQLLTTKKYVSPALLAILYIGLGDKEAALAWLQKAYDAHDAQMQYLKVDLHYDSLRSDPRFQELVRKVGLPQ
jgi:serine/threonine protein kinase/TolB-like protein/Tfp pilus assembly protein PilF